MAELMVRKATAADTEAVLDFYTRMIDEMHGTDFDVHWKHNVHPSHGFLRGAIAQDYLFTGITEDGCIASALVIDHTPAPGYDAVPWQVEAPPNKVGILHAVATRPAYHGQGFAYRILEQAIRTSREEGLVALRLDTFVSNHRAHGLYEKLGFKNLGAFPMFYEDLGTLDLDMFEYLL